MARIDYRISEADIPPAKFIRAMVTLLVQQLNALRSQHGMAQLTRAQIIAAIKAEIKNL